MVARFAALALLFAASTFAAGCDDGATIILDGPLEQVAAGGAHTCVLDPDGAAWCWGRGYTGELGDGSTSVRWSAVRVDVPEPLASITAGYFHTCGLGDSGTAYCWGWNRYGQVGIEGQPDVVPDPSPVAGGLTFVALAAGWYHTCGIAATGEAYCWGRNESGQLGDSTTVNRPVPTPVAGGATFAAVAGGAHHTCALSDARAALCWGGNAEGQLGDGTAERRLSPVAVTGGHAFLSIDGGRGHTCGLTPGDEILCWGSNAHGELGVGDTQPPATPGRVTPTQVIRDQAYRAVSAGADYSCAVDAGGVGYCWGSGGQAQLGTTLTSDRSQPTVVRTRGFRTISASMGTHTCGIDQNRQAACWGAGDTGQLGLPGTTYTTVPLTAGIRD